MLNVYAKFVWINKKIKDGGSILSISRGDQLNHSSNCSVIVGSQSHLCLQHIIQRSIFSSFECYQIVWLPVPRSSLLHPHYHVVQYDACHQHICNHIAIP